MRNTKRQWSRFRSQQKVALRIDDRPPACADDLDAGSRHRQTRHHVAYSATHDDLCLGRRTHHQNTEVAHCPLGVPPAHVDRHDTGAVPSRLKKGGRRARMMAGGTMLQERNHLRSKEIVARGASPIWTTLPPRSVADPCFRGATRIEVVPP